MTRRPLCLVLGCFLGGSIYQLGLFNPFWVTVLFQLTLVLIGIFFLEIKGRLLCLFLVCQMAFSLGALYPAVWEGDNLQMEQHVNKQVEINGRVLSVDMGNSGKYSLEVKLGQVQNSKWTESCNKVLIKLSDGSENQVWKLAGRNIKLRGILKKPDLPRNPGAFNYGNYLKSLKICGIMETSLKSIKVYDLESQVDRGISRIRWVFQRNVENYFDSTIGGLVLGMCLGERAYMDQELYELFQRNGACHILAVSGLHVGLLFSCIQAFLGKRKSILIYIIIIMVICFYVALAGFTPSAVRAGVMILIKILAFFGNRRYDLLTSGVITMFFMVLYNPFYLYHGGFQLSFIAIFSIGVLTPWCRRLWNCPYMDGVALQLGMAPWCCYMFNYISLIAFFINIPVLFLGGLLIPLVLFMLGISVLGDVVSGFSPLVSALSLGFDFLGICCRFFSKCLIYLNQLGAELPFSSFDTPSPSVLFLGIYYFLLFFLASEGFRILWQRGGLKILAIIIAAGLVLVFFLSRGMESDFRQDQLIFLDVGQGDCLLVRAGGKALMVDTGGSSRTDVGGRVLAPTLLKLGVGKLDAVCISHFHQDHCGGLKSMSEKIRVGKGIMYEGNWVIEERIREKTGMEPENYLYLTRGDRLEIGGDICIEALYPEEKGEEEYGKIMGDEGDENLSCLVVKIKVCGVTVLMTGDIDESCERKILELYGGDELNCHILKVAHHGSRFSSCREFLKAVNPELSVIQVGKNNYGHPALETLKSLDEEAIPVLRNDSQGAVGIRIKNGSVAQVHTMI